MAEAFADRVAFRRQRLFVAVDAGPEIAAAVSRAAARHHVVEQCALGALSLAPDLLVT